MSTAPGTVHIEPARHVGDLLGLSVENVRKRNSRYGHLMGWLPTLLGLPDQSLGSSRKQWCRPEQIDLQMMDVQSAPRTLANFGFDEWCSFLSLWRQGVAVPQLEQIFYLAADSLYPQLSKLQKLFERKGKRGGNTLVRKQLAPSGQLLLIPAVPRSQKELQSARHYYLSIQKLLMTDKASKYINGLRYFATHYRTWNNKILWQELESKQERHTGLSLLFDVMTPHIHPVTRPGVMRYTRSTGHLPLANPQTGKSSNGLYFALLLSCINQSVKA